MNDVPMYLLRGNAAPTAAQLVSADASVRWSLSKNPFLRGDGDHAVIADVGGHKARIRATVCDGRGQPLVQPVEITVRFIATLDTVTTGSSDQIKTGTDFTSFVATPNADGVIDLTIDFGAARADATFFIRHPYRALPVAALAIT